MAELKHEVDMRPFTKTISVEIIPKHMTELKWRLWIAEKLIVLAARIGNFRDVEINMKHKGF